MHWLKRICLWGIILFIALVLGSNIWVIYSTKDELYTEQNQLPEHGIALVLGTSHRTSSGGTNPFFKNRIETAAALYHSGKIDQFLLSGDNSSLYYNEPVTMQKALVKLGVPESAITLDYAGLRTLDSIVRCKEIFGQNKITIITQPFHSYRALFISQYYGMEAVAVVADEPGFEYSFKVRIREYMARTKAVLDLYVLKTTPRHMGQKEELNKG